MIKYFKKEESLFRILWLYLGVVSIYCTAHFVFSVDLVGPIVIFSSIVSILLLFTYDRRYGEIESEEKLFRILCLIILNGTIIRLFLAYTRYGNYDMQSFEIVAGIVRQGGNVYRETVRYNYSPLWSMILGFLKGLHLSFPALCFHFVQRAFMCGVDLATLLFLVLIARTRKISPIKTALFFYLNPVSFLLTGYHGQFENLALLMILIGIFAYIKLKNKPFLGSSILWLFSTLGMIIKHNIFYETIICMKSVHKRYWMRGLLFAISAILFLVSFAPYWEGGKDGIIKNAFLYPAFTGVYGITGLFYFPQMQFLFILALFAFPFVIKSKDIIKQCLLGVLFFLVFTTGISIQYFILPIALGALLPSRGFAVYSMLTAMFILGDFNNVNIKLFEIFHRWNFVWLSAIYWFMTEQYEFRLHKID